MGWGGSDMNTELIGMSNEELIAWVVKSSPVKEKVVVCAFPFIEAYCACHTISLGMFLEAVVALLNSGIKLPKAVHSITEAYPE